MSLESVVGFWQRIGGDSASQDTVGRLAKDKLEWARKIVEMAGTLGFADNYIWAG